MRFLAALLVAAAAAPFAFAGDKELAGCSCANECPLAQAVHSHRTWGEEAILASARVRTETVKVVVQNLKSF